MKKTFHMHRRVQFCETDMAGVLHFANYYRFMEEVEHAFWRSVGCSVMTRDGERKIGWPRVCTNCDYLAPARFEDELELVLSVANMSDQSVTYEVEFRHDGRRIALGCATAVCCAMKAGGFEAVSIPASLRTKLETLAGAERRDG